MTDYLQTLANQASDHLNAGRFPEAVAAFEQVLEREPDHPDLWYNLGYAQRRMRRFDDALASYRQALDRGVAEPEQVHLNSAVILASDLARNMDAEAELKAALAISPSYFPALLNLGGLYEDRGDREAARAAYEAALDIDPGDALVLTRLAVLSRIQDAAHPLIGQLRERIAVRGARKDEQADLGFALGQVLDGAGAYDEAYAAYAAANAASAASRGPNNAPYSPAVERKITDRIISSFAAPTATEQMSGDGAQPLFICGMFRSGSTLTEQILARHSRVTAGGELALIPAMIRAELSPYPEAATAAEPDRIARLRQSYLDGIAAIHPDADIVTDKRPVNFRYIGLIKRLFPKAKFVDTMRDPRDNCLSVWFAHLGPAAPYALDIDNIVHWYGEYRRLMDHWRSLWPDDIIELDYDALVAEPEPHIRGLVAACGLDWEDACLEPHAATNTVRTASSWQVREPLYKRSSGRWRNYERHIGDLLKAFPPA